MKFFHQVRDGERLPRLHGVVRYDCAWRHTVSCPIPFNLLVRLGLLIWIWLKRPIRIFDVVEWHYRIEQENRELRRQVDALRWQLAMLDQKPFDRDSI